MYELHRPGERVAARYRLLDLLTESDGGRFWRAHDEVLQRPVALHVLAVSDSRAPALMEAARDAATVHDPRVLRVLDAEEHSGWVHVVSEWGEGTSLDKLLSAEESLSPQRTAWLISEVADTVATAHSLGVAHGHLAPESILIEESGEVRIIGTAIEAALLGLPDLSFSDDVHDLAALVYACLTGLWPGHAHSDVPLAPRMGRTWMRPRQVKAGIPRQLDLLCDDVLNGSPTDARHARGSRAMATPEGLRDRLLGFVGAPEGAPLITDTGSFSALPQHLDPLTAPLSDLDPGNSGETEVVETVVDTGPVGRVEHPPDDDWDISPEDPLGLSQAQQVAPLRDVTPPNVSKSPPRPAEELPTEAGVPIFDEESDDVSWLNARQDRPPPPPPFESIPAKPLFEEDLDQQEPREPKPLFVDEHEPAWTYTPRDDEDVDYGDDPLGLDPPASDTAAEARPDVPTSERPTSPATYSHTEGNRPAAEPTSQFAPGAEATNWLELPGPTTQVRSEAPPPLPLPGNSGLPPRPFHPQDHDLSPRRSGASRGGEVQPWMVALVGLLVVAVVAALIWSFARSSGSDSAGIRSVATAAAQNATDGGSLDSHVLGGNEVSAYDYDPQASPAEENADEVVLALDNRKNTAWTTQTYKQQLAPDGLKEGVGLVIDLKRERQVERIRTIVSGATSIHFYMSDQKPGDDVEDLELIGKGRSTGTGLGSITTEPTDVSGRYLTVWLVDLPAADGGYEGQVAEVKVTARG